MPKHYPSSLPTPTIALREEEVLFYYNPYPLGLVTCSWAFKHRKNVLRQRECQQFIRRALMHFPTRYFVLLPLSAVISLLATSCAESKISQCNKIIQVANTAVSEAKAVTNGGQASDPKAMLKAADAMEKASQEMNVIEVKDAKLQDYKAAFISMYRDTSKATRDFITAFEKKDRPAAEVALKNLQQATVPEKQLVTDINSYCSGK